MRALVGLGALALLFAVGSLPSSPAGKPTVHSVTPDHGSTRANSDVRLDGEGFAEHGGVTIYFGEEAGRGAVVHSQNTITVRPPRARVDGPVDVMLRFSDGETAQLRGGYTFERTGGLQITPN